MAHIVKKKRGKHTYLAIQKTVWDSKKKKPVTQHIKYLGNAKNYDEEELKCLLQKYLNK